MPLERYGVLKGTVVDARREDDPDTPHYQVHVRAESTSYRFAVNVKSQLSPSELLFLVDDRFRHPLTTGLPALPHGFTELQREPGSLALDFIRGNLFDRLQVRPLPHNLPGPDNDLSDRVEHYVARARQEHGSEVYATPRASACGATSDSTLASTSCAESACTSNSKLPASSRAKERMSRLQ